MQWIRVFAAFFSLWVGSSGACAGAQVPTESTPTEPSVESESEGEGEGESESEGEPDAETVVAVAPDVVVPVAVSPVAAPVAPSRSTLASVPPLPAASEDSIHITAGAGRGLTISAGDAFSLQFRARAQFRDTLHVPNTADPTHNALTNEFNVRTIRLWFLGNVIDRNIRYGIQLALGPNDFEPNNPSPIFDAYVEFDHLRDLSVRVGQFFVPFDRARTIREFALQSVDRALMVRELSLDRDIGVMLFSNDLFGWDGRLSYNLGMFSGDGRNRLGTQPAGFLFVGRLAVRPMGSFDDDVEGDLVHTSSPHLAIGFGIAYNQTTDRPRSTTSVSNTYQFYQLGGFDYFHMAADLVFKWAGFSLLAEWLWRSASADSRMGTPAGAMTAITEYSRQGWGALAQVGMMLGDDFEVWGRYEHMEAMRGTDPTFIAAVNAGGNVTAGGVNCYLNGHFFKIQLDWQHSFGNDFGIGEHLVRMQLDATF